MEELLENDEDDERMDVDEDSPEDASGEVLAAAPARRRRRRILEEHDGEEEDEDEAVDADRQRARTRGKKGRVIDSDDEGDEDGPINGHSGHEDDGAVGRVGTANGTDRDRDDSSLSPAPEDASMGDDEND